METECVCHVSHVRTWSSLVEHRFSIPIPSDESLTSCSRHHHSAFCPRRSGGQNCCCINNHIGIKNWHHDIKIFRWLCFVFTGDRIITECFSDWQRSTVIGFWLTGCLTSWLQDSMIKSATLHHWHLAGGTMNSSCLEEPKCIVAFTVAEWWSWMSCIHQCVRLYVKLVGTIIPRDPTALQGVEEEPLTPSSCSFIWSLRQRLVYPNLHILVLSAFEKMEAPDVVD